MNLTMTADTVTLTVQEALEHLSSRRAGDPKVVHDHGSPFLSGEWRGFVAQCTTIADMMPIVPEDRDAATPC